MEECLIGKGNGLAGECTATLKCLCEEEAKLISLRCEVPGGLTAGDSVCKHHFQLYYSQFESRQKCCADPASRHRKQCKGKFSLSIELRNLMSEIMFPSCINYFSLRSAEMIISCSCALT